MTTRKAINVMVNEPFDRQTAKTPQRQKQALEILQKHERNRDRKFLDFLLSDPNNDVAAIVANHSHRGDIIISLVRKVYRKYRKQTLPLGYSDQAMALRRIPADPKSTAFSVSAAGCGDLE